MTFLDLPSGIAGEPTSVRRVCDLIHIFTDASPDDTRVVYRTYGMAGEDTEQPELQWATTIIEPGSVNGEPFMTRGHVHLKPERGEWMLTLGGDGELRLHGHGGFKVEPMRLGSIHMIAGSDAHRVVNTGTLPLAFVVVWLSDCGHNYNVAW